MPPNGRRGPHPPTANVALRATRPASQNFAASAAKQIASNSNKGKFVPNLPIPGGALPRREYFSRSGVCESPPVRRLAGLSARSEAPVSIAPPARGTSLGTKCPQAFRPATLRGKPSAPRRSRGAPRRCRRGRWSPSRARRPCLRRRGPSGRSARRGGWWCPSRGGGG